jgi:hypothetical protein
MCVRVAPYYSSSLNGPSVGLDDIAVCSWPYGIPVKGGPGLPTDQSNGGHTIKEPSLELWQFLNMCGATLWPAE